jgi:hypothetical protein
MLWHSNNGGSLLKTHRWKTPHKKPSGDNQDNNAKTRLPPAEQQEAAVALLALFLLCQ